MSLKMKEVTFVMTFGVANGKHSSLVHSEVTLDGLFIA